MLQIIVPESEQWDEKNMQFIYLNSQLIQLEHSLISLSKWESKWQKAFLGKSEKSTEEMIDYIKCMTTTQNVHPSTYHRLSSENIEEINKYISSPMTATKFFDEKNNGISRETITSELIYYWMISLNIPFECQKWHLNRLLTLIRVCNIKNQPPKKLSKQELIKRNTALNAARKSKLNTSG